MKVDILAVGIHPDDVELSASGTLLKHASLGYTFGLLDLTRGELGTRGSAEIRMREAAEASKILGAAFRKTLDLADGHFENNAENRVKIVRILRWCRPRIVLCNAPEDRHPDHGRAAGMTAEACFYAGLAKIETTDEDGLVQSPWRPQAVYHYVQDRQLDPDFIVDIGPWFEQKMQAILAFRSQFYQGDETGPQTPISGKSFLDFMKAKAAVFGRPINAEYAEGFIHSRTPGVHDLFHLV